MTGAPQIGYSKDDSSLRSEKSSYTQSEKDTENKLFELAEKRYTSEIERQKDLDNKAGNLIGYVGIVTSLTVGLGTFELFGNLTTIQYYALYIGGIVALGASVFFSLLTARVKNFRFSPTYGDIMYFYENPTIEYRTLLRTMISEMSIAFKENFLINNSKGTFLLIAWLAFMAGIVLLLSYAIVFTYEHEISNSTKEQLIPGSISSLDNNTLKALVSGA